MAKKKAKKRKAISSRKSWHGRLKESADQITAELLASLDNDIALWKYDIAGSLAHAQMLCEVGVLTNREFASIKSGMKSIAQDIETGKLKMDIQLEDIHMVIEAALIKRIGSAGAKLHTGRSRNDQVAMDMRLYARDAVDTIREKICKLQRAFVQMADKQGDVIFPSYTHLQRAQPILAGHGLLTYVEMLQRDNERLADARKRINICPLGSGAVAGTSLPIDRARTAELLGFPQYSRNSIDGVSDRDFMAELCFACSMISVHLSRWCEDWIIYSSTEFDMVELGDAYCTSSSMMPQKKNADTLELIRGKSAMTISDLMGILTLTKGLPLAYNRDMQDDKHYMINAVETVIQALTVSEGIVSTARLKVPDLRDGFLDATSLAEYLTARGVPFREAHGIVGRVVAAAERDGVTLSEISPEELGKHSDKIDDEVNSYLGSENVVKRYFSDGAGGRRQLKRQLTFWKRKLGSGRLNRNDR